MLSASSVSFFSGLVLAHLGKETCSSSTAKTLQVGIRLPPYVAFSLSTRKEVVGGGGSVATGSQRSCALACSGLFWYYSASADRNIELAPSLLIILQEHSASALKKKLLAVFLFLALSLVLALVVS